MSLVHKLFFCVFFHLTVPSTCYTNLNGCNYILRKRTGTLSFQNTNDLANEGICTWRIFAKGDENIMLNITDIDIEKSPNCTLGYVEIRDGFWKISPIIGRFCGFGSLEPVLSTTNKMLITYFHLKPNKGFRAQYEAICGGEIFVEDSYTLESHSSSDLYPPNKKCFWQIIVPEKHQVVLKFQRFELEDHVDCLYDYVEILDGSTLNSTSFGTFCKNEIPPEIISTSNTLLIKFVSDMSIQKQGFSAIIVNEFDEYSTPFHRCVNTVGNYTSTGRNGFDLRSDDKTGEFVCGGTMNSPQGVIQSPSFPQRYPKNKTCTWEIQSTPGSLIVLNFTHFDIEGGNANKNMDKGCVKDKLEIRNVFSENGSRHQGFYCGSDLPDAVLSESNRIQIIFNSDTYVEKSGFSMNYYTVRDACADYNGNCQHKCVNSPPSKYPKCVCPNEYFLQENGLDCKKSRCQYEIASTFGYIESPNFPSHYSNNERCKWQFRTTPGHRIKLDFSELSLAEDCRYDYLAIWDGTSDTSPSLGKFCKGVPISTVTSTFNEMFVFFLSDISNVDKGFQAKYLTVCGGTLNSTIQESFIFSHANYSSSDYAESTNCEWIVKSLSGHNTNLTFQTFGLEESEDCRNDFVEILENDSILGKFCGSSKPLNGSFTFSGSLTIRFRSDGDNNGRGFKIKYTAVLGTPVVF